MAYSTINKHTDYFNTKLYTGNGGTQSITGIGFQPDMVWCKTRSYNDDHTITDVIRGTTKAVFPNSTNAENTSSIRVTAFDSDGFTLGNAGDVNSNSATYVNWSWKAGGTGSANTDGDINSTVSANTTAGCSIVKYTGNGSNDQRIGHGLGARPTMWMIKRLGTTDDWIVYHQGISTNWYDDTYLYLNSTNAAMGSVNAGTGNPTTSVFYIGDSDKVGKSGDDYIAYVFAEKTGYSKFGSFTSNNSSDGSFIYTGFAPSFVMIKEHDGTNQWLMYDNKRPGYNMTNRGVFANANANEATDLGIDILSNGFKIRATNNQNSGNYIYMSFGQSLVGSNNIPVTAR